MTSEKDGGRVEVCFIIKPLVAILKLFFPAHNIKFWFVIYEFLQQLTVKKVTWQKAALLLQTFSLEAQSKAFVEKYLSEHVFVYLFVYFWLSKPYAKTEGQFSFKDIWQS